MIVKFSNVDEFIGELREEKNHVDRSIVRVTQRSSYKESPSILNLSIIATCIIKNQIVIFEHFCGQIFSTSNDSISQKVRDQAREISEEVETKVKELGLFVRIGIIEEGDKDEDGT